MRADGKIERHDELLSTVYYNAQDEFAGEADSTATINEFYDYVEQALRLYQCYYIPHPVNPLVGIFPFAWDLEEGMYVHNDTLNVSYKIETVQRDSKNMPTGYVSLSGGNGLSPSATHRFDEFYSLINKPIYDGDGKPTDKFTKTKVRRGVAFMHAFPKTFAQTYNFSADGSGKLTQATADWADTITWLVTRKEPGGRGGKGFSVPRDIRPHIRKQIVYGPDSNYIAEFTGQWFDAIIQLDCWTKTNATAERLVEWLEGFMETYLAVFRYNGVSKIIYWDRTADELVTRWRDDIVNRTLRYYVRTENVAMTLQSKVRSITAMFGLMPSGVYWPIITPWGTGWTQPTGMADAIPVEVYNS